MTCQELRLYFEDPMRADARFEAEAEHLAHCEECARFVEQQQEVGAGLRLARMSVPNVPRSLDTAVLASYRRQISERRASARTAPKRRFAILCWSAAAAAIVIVAALLTFSGRRTTATVAPPDPASSAAKPERIASTSPATKPQPQMHKRSHPQRPQRSDPSNVVLTGSLPPDFRSLMYCDQLSCSGPMEVIRMQLPASAAMFALSSNSAHDTILADVLVGPDGIARGIRIVQ
jgi:hypothetical protein